MDIRRTLAAGIIASIVMGMVEMVYEAVAGTGFWSPLVFIAATVLRGLQSVQHPVPFLFGGVVVGLMGHMMNSVILGLLFTWIVLHTSLSRVGLIGAGVVYAFAVFAVMWYGVLPTVDPAMLALNGSVFALAHAMWGAALGLVAPLPSEAAFSPRTA